MATLYHDHLEVHCTSLFCLHKISGTQLYCGALLRSEIYRGLYTTMQQASVIARLFWTCKKVSTNLYRSIFEISVDFSEQVRSGVGAITIAAAILLLAADSEVQIASLVVMTMGIAMVSFALPRWKPSLMQAIMKHIFPPIRTAPIRSKRTREMASSRTFAPRLRVTAYQNVAAVLFLLILVLLYNPFIAIDGHLKFAIIVSIICGAIIWASAVRAGSGMRTDAVLILFFLLYAAAAVRMNTLSHDGSFDYLKAILQPLVWVSLSAGALFVARRVGIRSYTNILTTIVGLVCLALLANYRFLIDPPTYSPVGDFTFDSYQQVSTVFGIVGIVCFVRLMGWRRGSAIRWFSAVAFIVCAWVVAITSARGEQVAFVVATLIVLIPRLFIMIAAIAAFSLPAIIAVLAYYKLPSVERFQIALDLGWEEPRVVLLRQSLSLIANDGATWLVGGGADYFQKFYRFPEAMHPHNFVLEAWISGGILLAIATFIIFVAPVAMAYWRLLTNRPVALDVFAVALFVLILAAKSTAFTSNWLLALVLPFFVYLRETNSSQPSISQPKPLARPSALQDRRLAPAT